MENNLEQRRCPECHGAPDVETVRDQIWISCKQHGHLAMGDMVHEAIANWNHYIAFVEKAKESKQPR